MISMDLSLGLIGILGVIGYNMNKTVNSRTYIEKRSKLPESEKSSGKSVYESKDYVKIHKDEKERVERADALIKNTNKYSISVNTTGRNGENPPAKKVSFYREDISSETKRPIKNKEKIYSGPMFSLDKFYQPEKDNKEFVTKEGFDSVSELSNTKTDYSHNNMTPFFGSKIKGGGSSAGILDRYSGNDKPARSEVSSVQNGKQNIYGARPFTTLFDQDRFNSGNKQGGVVPFKQYKVAPIPGEYVRPEFKGVDELRYLNNPKIALEGRMISGASIGQRSEIGVDRGVTVETTWGMRETLPTGDKFTRVTGVNQNHEETFRNTTRSSTTEVMFNQAPAFNKSDGRYVSYSKKNDGSGTYNQEAKRNSFKNDWVRNNRQNIPLRYENEQNNIHLREQERESMVRENIGGMFDKSKGMVVNTVDKPRVTNKQLSVYEYTGTANSQNVHVPESRESYYSSEISDKALPTNYTFNGVAFGASAAGPESVHIGIKQKASVKDHKNPAKSNKHFSPTAELQGEYSGKVGIFGMEHDFTERLDLKR